LTYGQVNERANQLAHVLRELGAGPGQVVAVMVERSFAMMVGLLGILKAGAAYLPLDPSYPAERLAFMLQGTTLLHTGSIATMLAPGATDVLAAVEYAHPRATISFDPNCRPSIITDVDYARRQAEKFVTLADIVKASDGDYPQLSPEQIIQRNPQVIVLAVDDPSVTPATVKQRPGWSVIDAVRNDRICVVDADIVSRPGPRVVDGLQALAKCIYPGQF